MRKHFLPTTFAVPVLALMLCVSMRAAVAQQMEHSPPTTPSTRLTIKTYDGKTLTLTPEELAALPHKSVSVFNAHSKTNAGCETLPRYRW
jgi:hypothetical protein